MGVTNYIVGNLAADSAVPVDIERYLYGTRIVLKTLDRQIAAVCKIEERDKFQVAVQSRTDSAPTVMEDVLLFAVETLAVELSVDENAVIFKFFRTEIIAEFIYGRIVLAKRPLNRAEIQGHGILS